MFFAHHSIPLISIVVIQFWMFMCVSLGFHCFMHIGIHLHPFKIYDMRKSNANLQKISVPNDLHLAVQYGWLEYAFYWKMLVWCPKHIYETFSTENALSVWDPVRGGDRAGKNISIMNFWNDQNDVNDFVWNCFWSSCFAR